MSRAEVTWQRTVAPHFDFLTEHGFRPLPTKDGSFWATSCHYGSATAAVEVTRSNEFRRVEVSLIRLVDGAIPPYPIWVTSEPLHHTLLDNVLEACQSPMLNDSALAYGLGARDIQRQLVFWADALRIVAPEFLAGDLSAIDEAEDVIRARVAEHPQEIVTWLPDDASQDDESAAMEQMRIEVPPEVSVTTRRYRRSPEGPT